MSNSKAVYTSINQAVDEAVTKFRSGKSIEDDLLWINSNEEELTIWAYETETFFDENYAFLTTEEELFVTNDNLLEYFDAEDLALETDEAILDFINSRVTDLLDAATAAHFHYRDGIYLTINCQSLGQAGLHFSCFDIYRSKESYFNHLIVQGYMPWYTNFLNHSDTELISMFKKNVTRKYFCK